MKARRWLINRSVNNACTVAAGRGSHYVFRTAGD